MQLVIVKFLDPTTFGHWATMEELTQSGCRVCIAAGWLIEQTDDMVKVALLTTKEKDSVSNWVNIPVVAILSIDVIKDISLEEL